MPPELEKMKKVEQAPTGPEPETESEGSPVIAGDDFQSEFESLLRPGELEQIAKGREAATSEKEPFPDADSRLDALEKQTEKLSVEEPEKLEQAEEAEEPKAEAEAEAEEKPPAEELPAEEPVVEEPPEELLEEPVPTAMQAEIERLRALVNELSSEGGKELEEPEAPKAPQGLKFMTDAEAEGLLEDPRKINVGLNRVYRYAAENVYKSVVEVVKNLVSYSVTMHEKGREFYGANMDLVPFKGFVSKVARELQSEHPDWDVDTLFNNVGREARERLALGSQQKPAQGPMQRVSQRPGAATPQAPAHRPGFARPAAARRVTPADNRSKFDVEFEELLNLRR